MSVWNSAVSQENWIAEMEHGPIALLLADTRFPNATILKTRFETSVLQWRKDGHFRPVINNGNEIAAAVALLKNMEQKTTLSYEPRLKNTAKSIDFRVDYDGEIFCWIDVKTIAPGWQDDDQTWEKYEAISKAFPANAKLIVDRDQGGAALSGQEFKARWTLLRRTIDAEKKFGTVSV